MTCLLDVQFDQDILVIANAVGLDLVQNLTHHGRSFGGCLGNRLIISFFKRQQRGAQNSLPLTTASADRLDPETALRIFLE